MVGNAGFERRDLHVTNLLKTLTTLKTYHETHVHVPLCLSELIARVPPLSVTDRGRPK